MLNKAITAVSVILSLFFSWLLFLNHVSVREVGIAYDSGAGRVASQLPGWHVTSPLVRVTYVPTTPFWVEVNTSAKIRPRKLVKFNAEHVAEFIELQGFSYIDSAPVMFSGYAFSGKEYPFLTILE